MSRMLSVHFDAFFLNFCFRKNLYPLARTPTPVTINKVPRIIGLDMGSPRNNTANAAVSKKLMLTNG